MLEKFFLILLISTVFNFNFLSSSTLEIQSDFPKKTGESFGVKINAKSAVVIDAKAKKILFEKEAHKKLPPASLTKIMTVLVALDSNIKLDQPIKISEKSQKMIERTVGLEKDEVVKVKDLIAGSLIASGNDAAQALVEAVSGSDISKFIDKMNERAAKLNLVNTHFENPTGLDSENQFSSAYDLAIIFSEAMKNLTFRELIAKKNYEIIAITPEKTHKFETSNHLLRDDYPRVFGGKTGYTDNAGYCLINLAKDKNNNQIITVILGASLNEQHFQDTKALIDWTYQNYKFQK
ncbi:MAG: D-alanyl-D-alanine carboxypeptidase family protein [Patescibacteria group bacterium]